MKLRWAAKAALMGRIACRTDHLDHQQAPGPAHGVAAVAEDRQAPPVVPIVEDALEQVGVRSDGEAFEEIAANHLTPVRHVGRPQNGIRFSHHLRLVEEDAPQGRIRSNDGRQQNSLTAADVDQHDAEVTLGLGQHGLAGGERLEHQIVDLKTGALDALQ